MFRHLLIWVVLVVALIVPRHTIEAQQPLPGSPWYMVVYQPENDSLRWINALGEQASIPRPMLNNEAQYLDMRVSPNGETLVMTAQLNNGLQALGIYDLASGIFVQTHIAQPNETIHLGEQHSFTAGSEFFAVGFSGGDFSNPTWRVILFDSSDGEVASFIDHTHPEAPDLQLSIPIIQVIDGLFIHFQMVPQAVGGATTWPAYAWRAFFGPGPDTPTIIESPYILAEKDFLPIDGRVATVFTDPIYASAQPSGLWPNFNAVGWNLPDSDDSGMTTVHADSSRYHLMARWANNGEWLLFLSQDASENSYWNIVLANGTPDDNSFIPLSPEIEQVYGLTNGYLLVNADDMLIYSNGFNPNTAPDLVQLTVASEIVYVTPIGATFELEALTDAATTNPQQRIIITPDVPAQPQQPTSVPVVDCSLAPSQRVGIGSGARVLPSVGGLNLRAEPNGAILLTMTGGDTLDVTGGPICDDGLYWWQVNRVGTVGWVAEATANGYFIEPYDGPPPAPPAPEVQPPAEEPAFVCEGAPDTRLAIGVQALFITNQSPRNIPNGDTFFNRAFMSGTRARIDAGPQCVNGQIWWQVSGFGLNTATDEATAINGGWVAETTSSGQYRMGP
jgi:hypothetical protein